MSEGPATEEQLMARLDGLGIAVATHRHPPVFTVEEARALRGDLPGGHCKCLFLKDKKGALWLVVVSEETQVDLKALQAALGAARFSFGKPELLREVLGVEPGTVTPFALVNAAPGSLQVVLEAAMLENEVVNYHPLTNAATAAIAPADLVAFIRDCGFEPRILDFAAAGAA